MSRIYRIWSFIEILKIFRTHDVLTSFSLVAEMRGRFSLAADSLSQTQRFNIERSDLLPALGRLEDVFRELNLPHVLISIWRAKNFVEGKDNYDSSDCERVAHFLDGVLIACGDTLSTQTLAHISSEAVSLLHPLPAPFGEKVAAAFPDAQYDVEEAGRCLALGRSTAAVFHAMRAAECGVREVAKHLSATHEDEHGRLLAWGILVSNIKCKIDGLGKGPKQDEWYKLHSALHTVNRAYRTKTAHPESKYTEQEAFDAYTVTRHLMIEAASLLLSP